MKISTVPIRILIVMFVALLSANIYATTVKYTASEDIKFKDGKQSLAAGQYAQLHAMVSKAMEVCSFAEDVFVIIVDGEHSGTEEVSTPHTRAIRNEFVRLGVPAVEVHEFSRPDWYQRPMNAPVVVEIELLCTPKSKPDQSNVSAPSQTSR